MKKEKHYLSKSSYIRGLQCLKSLYLYKKRYFLRDRLSPLQLAKFKRGHQVGLLARECWPGGIDLSPKSPSQYPLSVEKTMEMILGEKQDVLYEATFQHKEVLVMMDILVKEGADWIAYEVKSSLSISDTYLEDAALQYYVISGAGLPLKDIRVLYLNADYCRGEHLELGKLFRWESVIEFAKGRRHFIEQNIESMLDIKDLTKSPDIPTGQHCLKPYACDFIGHCWKSQKLPQVEGLEKWASGWKTLSKEATDSTENRKDILILSFFTTKPAIPVFLNNRPFQPLLAGICTYDTRDQSTASGIAIFPEDKPDTLVKLLIEWTQAYQVILAEDASAFQIILEGLISDYPHLTETLRILKQKVLGLREMLEEWINLQEVLVDPAFPGALRLAVYLELVMREEIPKIDSSTLAGEAYRLICFSDHKNKNYKIEDLEAYLRKNCQAMEKLTKGLY